MRPRSIALGLSLLAVGASITVAAEGHGIDVAFDEAKALVWADGVAHASWNVYAGDLQDLRDTGIYTQAAGPLVARSCDLVAPRFTYDDVPEPGRCAFLLVSGNSVVEGGLGTDSSGGIESNTRSCHPDLLPPESSGTPSAVGGQCRGLVVSWPPSPSRDVTIYRLRAGTSPATPLWVWPVTGTVQYIDGLSDATTYYLSVVAVDAEGNESTPTGEIEATTVNTTTPAAPKDLSIADGGPGVVNALAWTPVDRNVEPLEGDPASPLIRDLAGYRVYRSAGGDLPLDDAHRIADLEGAVTVDGDLVRACSHAFYTVTAVDTCGREGAPAAKAEAVAAAGPAPRPPAAVHVTPIGATNVVSWSPSTADVEGRPIAPPTYRIERAGPMKSPPADGDFQTIATVDGTRQTIDATFPLTHPDEKLYYRVRAEDECPTRSAPSPIVEAVCPFPGDVRINPPFDGQNVGGLIPVTVWVLPPSGPMSRVTITYTHTLQGTTRTYTASGNGPWTDAGWLGSSVGDSLITARVTAANGCVAEKSIRVHTGTSVGMPTLIVN